MAKTLERQPATDRSNMSLAAGDDATQVAVAQIRIDGGTQMRAGLNEETVSEYAGIFYTQESISRWPFPPVVVYHDGDDYWLADGFHRLAAMRRVLHFEPGDPNVVHRVPAIVKSGTRREAVLHAAGANADHGLRRSNADKRRAVETLLADSEWSAWSDREIARHCKVDHKTVGAVRRELELTGEIPQSTARQGADGRTINTAAINAGRPTTPPSEPVYTEPETPAPPDGYTLQHHPGRGWQWQRALDEYTTIAGNILSTAEEAVAEAEHDLAERHARKAAKTTHFAPRAEPLRHPVATGWPDDAEAGWRFMESQNARFDAAGYKLQYNYPAHKQGEPCMRWVRIGTDGTPVYGETVGGGNERSRVIEDALLAQGEPFAASYAGAKVVYVEPVPEPAPESEPPVAKPARGTPEYAAYRAQACRAAIGEAEKWLATLDEIGELTGLYGQATRDKRSVREWITVLARHAE